MADSTPMTMVTVEGVNLTAQVESVDVEDHDHAIDRARVVFDSAGDVSKILREQSRVKISLGWSDENALVFEGVVMSVKTEGSGTGPPRVTLTAYDLSYKLKQNQKGKPSKDRYFMSGKLSGALAAILAEYPDVAVGQILPDPNPALTPAQPWGKPAGQSDWDFIMAAALRWKARAFVEVNDTVSKFYFVSEKSLLKGDPMGVLHYCAGGVGPLLEFKFERTGSGAAPVASVTVTDPKTGQPVTQDGAPPDPEAPLAVDPAADATLAQAATLMAQAAGQPADGRPVTAIAGQPSDPGLALHTVLQDPTRVLGYAGHGVCRGTIKLRAKGKVTIKGLPPWVEGDWYVHRVNHVFTRISVLDRNAKAVDRSTFQTKFSATR